MGISLFFMRNPRVENRFKVIRGGMLLYLEVVNRVGKPHKILYQILKLGGKDVLLR